MNREAHIERVGNLLAGAAAFFWFARGALVFSGLYRDETVEFLHGAGLHGAAGPIMQGFSAVFLVIGCLVVFRPADVRLHAAEIGVIGIIVAGLTWVRPEAWWSGYAPLTKAFGVIGTAFILIRMARRDEPLEVIERRLTFVLGLIWCVAGAVGALAPPGLETRIVGDITGGAVAGPIVRAGGVVMLVTGVALLLTGAQGSVTRSLVWAQMAAACIVPAVASAIDPSLLYHPLAPFLHNLPLLGLAAGALQLGRLDELRFYGILRRLERSESMSSIVVRLQAVRFGEPFGRIAEEEKAQAGGLRGMLKGRDPYRGVATPLFGGVAFIVGTVLILLPRRAGISVVTLMQRRMIRRYTHILDLLPPDSVSRRVIDDLIAAETRHVRWLRDAA